MKKKRLVMFMLAVGMLITEPAMTMRNIEGAQIQTEDQEIKEDQSVQEEEATKANPIKENGISFELNASDKTAKVVKYEGADKEVVIPQTIQNGEYKVTAIGYAAFKRKKIEKIEIPEGVKEIEQYAFYESDQLKNVKLPVTLEKIGYCAFYHCSALQEITIPVNVKKIDTYSFKLCTGLKKINWPVAAVKQDMGEGVFEFDTALTSVKIPGTCIGIGRYAFRGCNRLKKAVYGTNELVKETEIRYSAFEECTRLKEVRLPDSLVRIENSVFQEDVNLEKISFPNGLKKIGRYAFCGCNKLKKMTLPESLNFIAEHAFAKCEGLESVKWKERTEGAETAGEFQMEEGIFYGCKGLTKIIIPKHVTRISRYAFEKCSKLKQVCISDQIQEIGEKAFTGCSKGLVIRGDKKSDITKAYAKENKYVFVNKVQTPSGVKARYIKNKKCWKIAWKKAVGATSYVVYKKNGNRYKKVKEVKGTNLQVSEKGVYVVKAKGSYYGRKVSSAYSKNCRIK